MAKFTTEKRRSLTSSKAEITDHQTTEFTNLQLDLSLGGKIKEDASNNNIYRILNSELNGLAFEYRYLYGRYHPDLDEQEYFYKVLEDDEEVVKSYWDSPKLQLAGSLTPGNEFHLNTREGTTVKYPIHPDKYARWEIDSHEYVEDFETTETNMINMVRTLNTWNTSGGGTGNLETTLFGEYAEKILGLDDDKQPYMTVGYTAYQTDPNDGYMTPGYDKTGEIILINDDLENFSFGKVVASRDMPSRILFVPYGKIGKIPDGSVITSTFTIGSQINKVIAEQICFNLQIYFKMTKHYLNNNPNKEDANNAPIVSSIDNVINLFDIWEIRDDRDDFPVMLQLMDDIETERDAQFLINRSAYINSYLSTATQLYSDRFDIIDLRLTKDMGTLKEVMSAQKGINTITGIFSNRDKTKLLYTKYFIVKWAILNGDYYMRIFVEDADGLSVGDTCFMLSDNEDVPEIEAKITEIVDGRVVDQLNTVYTKDGNIIYAYTDCKKVFFGREIFSPKYITTEGFRIIKEI